jgi:hypothetical protein
MWRRRGVETGGAGSARPWTRSGTGWSAVIVSSLRERCRNVQHDRYIKDAIRWRTEAQQASERASEGSHPATSQLINLTINQSLQISERFSDDARSRLRVTKLRLASLRLTVEAVVSSA